MQADTSPSIPLPERGGEGGGGGAHGVTRPTSEQREPLRLPPVQVVPQEKMTMRQVMEAQANQQAGITLECEVKRLAREHGLDTAEVVKLAEAARAGFRIVNGEPVPVAGDRQTVVLSADGVNVMSIAEWVAKKVRGQKPEDGGQAREEDEVLPMRNPFRGKTWNLTEQMRLLRRDPKLARRLKAEAWAAGEDRKK